MNNFQTLVQHMGQIGFQYHSQRLIDHAIQNLSKIQKTIKDLPFLSGQKAKSAIVISAGPSVYKQNSIQRILDASYSGTIIAIDGSYIACLKKGLIPDYVMTLDPHPTRIVRWFGDPEFEKHSQNDDYFSRQDLDIEFRKNTIEQNKVHIQLVNQYGHLTKAIVSSSSPNNVIARLEEAHFDQYWWNPLVDDVKHPKSLTRTLYNINKLPCMNTGGTVGTAAWVFASCILKLPVVSVVGMDLGYYKETPLTKTQTYYELINHLGTEEGIEEYFVDYEFPLTKEKFYTDPTYFWYRKNFLELLRKSSSKTVNCTEGGTLIDPRIPCLKLDEFLKDHG